ncbi:hypothetical protein KSZ_61000 [Dictyobacter formicarum]|uniref:Transposase zinc-binding domain-containing protein n=1 Tax=Dictyobacter formicarum TaxID=2778368 RepID=A0ABQ3VPC0_9CHLR|nr:hypothetical protein KSZ_61000 [Dictyobacter formicarum]
MYQPPCARQRDYKSRIDPGPITNQQVTNYTSSRSTHLNRDLKELATDKPVRLCVYPCIEGNESLCPHCKAKQVAEIEIKTVISGNEGLPL